MSAQLSMSTSHDSGVVARLARAAKARLLWLQVLQIDELTTRYLEREDIRRARELAATGAQVSAVWLGHMVQPGNGCSFPDID